jgi:hypothetical protein
MKPPGPTPTPFSQPPTTTAHSLFLTSKYISSVSSRFLSNTLCLPGVDRLERALCHLASLPPYLRQVYTTSSWADRDGEIPPERSLKRLVRYYSSPATQNQACQDQIFIHMPSSLLSQLLLLHHANTLYYDCCHSNWGCQRDSRTHR